MKKGLILLAILGSLGLVFFAQAQNDLAQESIEKVDKYTVELQINPDASLQVQETIAYDFGSLERYGIYRDIPYKYQARGGNFNLRLSEIAVTDEKGQAYNFEVLDKAENKEIKIGDADKTISGKKIYVISYKVGRAINYFSDQDELYWNAVGDQWSLPIQQVSVSVRLPQKVAAEKLRQQCFAGYQGTKNPCQQGEIIIDENGQSDMIKFVQESLDPLQGLTVVAGFPTGLVKKPTAFESFLQTLKDNWVLGVPIITLLVLYYFWYTKGRDPEGKETIIVQYDVPDRLSPMEMGAIMEENIEKKHISATIVGLAVRGYLRITRLEEKVLLFKSTDYLLEQLKPATDLEKEFEKDLLTDIFSFGKAISGKEPVIAQVKLSQLKEKFHKKLEGIKDKAYQSVVSQGYFPQNPNRVKNTFVVIGVLIIAVGIIGGSFLTSLIFIGSFVVSGIMTLVFASRMPRRTFKGVATKEYILGLKDYLQVAEKDRIKFHNAPEKSPKVFEKFLAFAMVLGVEKEWAQQFEDIYNQSPDWYHDPTGSNFTALYFANSLNDFSSSAGNTLAAPPSSAAGGGSGFSGGGGGGFGGGGGGSW